jgi:hypothetical protein
MRNFTIFSSRVINRNNNINITNNNLNITDNFQNHQDSQINNNETNTENIDHPTTENRSLPGIENEIQQNRNIDYIDIPLYLPNTNNRIWTSEFGRNLLNELNFQYENLENLVQDNDNTSYEFNLLIQRLMGGDVNVGVKDFNKIVTVLNIEDLNNTDTCSICLENLKEILNNKISNNSAKINVPVKTTCNHLYCRDCLLKWLTNNKTCPICKNEFENEDEDENNNNSENIINNSDSEQENTATNTEQNNYILDIGYSSSSSNYMSDTNVNSVSDTESENNDEIFL